jgi:type IV pilus assembly protein PilX
MTSLSKHRLEHLRKFQQRGISLFFALVALVALSLAAVALIRSVDTAALVAGNLAFKQAATTSGDAGVEAALSWLVNTQAANNTKNVLTDATHAFNINDLPRGYYSNADPTLDLFAASTWANNNSVLVGASPDPVTGNTTRFIIQRLCRNANQPVQTADCLFSGAMVDNNGQQVPLPQEVCKGPGCPAAGQSPQIRITSRVTGPRNTISYVQAFVY